MTAKTYGKGEIELGRNAFLNVGATTNTNLYYVQEGSLRIFWLSEHEEHTIRFAYKGNFLTALDSFLTGSPSKYYIQALKKSKLSLISKPVYEAFLNSNTEHLQLWNKLLSLLVLDQLEREQDILISSPLERYKRVLRRSPQLFQEIPHKYIASYLRMSAETLSRISKILISIKIKVET